MLSRDATTSSGRTPGRAAFTLIELLIVLGIIVLLIGLLMPQIARTRWEAQSIQCASNIRQICLALTQYANTYQGRLPPSDGYDRWYDEELIGPFLPGPSRYKRAHDVHSWVIALGGGTFRCPEDDVGSIRSYSMNEWASSRPRPAVLNAVPRRGVAFDLATAGGDRLILVTEAFSWLDETGSGLFATDYKIGAAGVKPGLRFGGGGGIAPPLSFSVIGRFAPQNTELPFYRHRRHSSRDAGAVHIGFMDAHVARFNQADLVDLQTGRSSLAALWTPIDPELEP
jgi:hypothetical protein